MFRAIYAAFMAAGLQGGGESIQHRDRPGPVFGHLLIRGGEKNNHSPPPGRPGTVIPHWLAFRAHTRSSQLVSLSWRPGSRSAGLRRAFRLSF